MKNTRKLFTILTLPALALLFFTAVALWHMPDGRAAKPEDIYRQLETFTNVLHIIEENYVEEVDANEAIQGAIKGMLQSLDPHSSFLRAEDYKELQMETKGNFTGIGIEITMRDNILTVVSPIEGTPAYRQGLQAGDRIMRIDGESTKDISLMDAVKRLRGPKGSEVVVSIMREGWSEFHDITIVRDIIPIHSVKSRWLEPGYAHIRVSNFQSKTTRDVRDAIDQMRQEGPIKGMILDLRNNPGGLLDQAVQLSDIFLASGTIVSTRGRIEEQNMLFEARDDGKDEFDAPLVVLVNQGSASASEIVAGALRDHKRAMLIGTPTFGKGSVQTIIPLNDGAGLRLTTALYYTPNGISIQAKGITPDVEVENAPAPLSEEKDEANGSRSRSIREQDLPRHLDNGDKSREKVDENGGKDDDTAKLLARDRQLQTGLMLLKGIQIFTTP